jgi:hypothetical protein
MMSMTRTVTPAPHELACEPSRDEADHDPVDKSIHGERSFAGVRAEVSAADANLTLNYHAMTCKIVKSTDPRSQVPKVQRRHRNR